MDKETIALLEGPWALPRITLIVTCPLCGAIVDCFKRMEHIRFHQELDPMEPVKHVDDLAWPEPGDSW